MADRRLAWAVVAVIVRYVSVVQPQAHREIARWRRRTHAITDRALRLHVAHPFDVDMSAEGAAVFAVLRPSHKDLVGVLIAYVLLWSYVDVVTERDPQHDPRLFRALVDALNSDAGSRDYGEPDDGGYLRDLMRTCQEGCARLPGWAVVRSAALELAEHGAAVQALNHGQVEQLPAAAGGADWHEICAAASSPLAIHALLALAANPSATADEAQAVADAYFPAISALAVMADHFIDAVEDDALNNHSYVGYFGSADALHDGLRDLASRARSATTSLPQSERHLVILAAMVSMFFSDEGQPHGHGSTARAVLDAVGPATVPMLAILRCKRRAAGWRRPRSAPAR